VREVFDLPAILVLYFLGLCPKVGAKPEDLSSSPEGLRLSETFRTSGGGAATLFGSYEHLRLLTECELTDTLAFRR
jgi:hypothetical protein